MKPHIFVAGVLSIICLFALTSVEAQSEVLRVEYATICMDVVDRNPVNPGNEFPASVGRLYCFTKISGAHSPTRVAHVWYYGDTERARVSLGVSAAAWRTYSSKRIQSHEIGAWHVDVLGPDAKVLHAIHFEITP